jgi:hypothetical protein
MEEEVELAIRCVNFDSSAKIASRRPNRFNATADKGLSGRNASCWEDTFPGKRHGRADAAGHFIPKPLNP